MNELTPPDDSLKNQIIKRRDPPVLIGNGKKKRSSRVGWNHVAAFGYLAAAADRFVTVDELARVFYHRVTDDGRRKVRKNLSPFLKYVLLQHGYVLVVEPQNARGRAGAVKILNPTSPYEINLAQVKGKIMKKTGELKLEEYQKYVMAITHKTGLPEEGSGGTVSEA